MIFHYKSFIPILLLSVVRLFFFCVCVVWNWFACYVNKSNETLVFFLALTRTLSLSLALHFVFYSNINNDFCECNICIHFATLRYVIVSVFSISFFISFYSMDLKIAEMNCRETTYAHTHAQIVTINGVDQNKSTLIELKLQSVHTHTHTLRSIKHLNSQQTYYIHNHARASTQSHKKVFNLIRI